MVDLTSSIRTSEPDPTTQPQQPNALKTYDLSKPILSLPNGLTLRHHRPSDAASLSKHASNRKITQQMSNRFPDPCTLEKTYELIEKACDETKWRAIGPTDPESNNTAGSGQILPTNWIVALDDEAVGGIGYQFQTDVFSRSMSFGYWLGEEHWNKGIMSTVLPAFVDWVWETYPWLIRLEPSVYGWNKASARLLEKCGFEFEGTRRCAVEKYGVLGDVLNFGMLRKGFVVTGAAPER